MMGAMLTLIAGACITGGIIAYNNAHNEANTAGLAQPYVNVTFKKVMDGTGWNEETSDNHNQANANWTPKKNSHTFIVKENGFRIADNTPVDGVVASGDTVEYNLVLDFTAAKQRTINVSFDVSDGNNTNPHAYLTPINATNTFCKNTGFVKAT